MAANLSQLFVGLFNSATGGYANQYSTSQANALASVVSIVAGQDLSSDTAFINYALSNLGVPASGAVHDAAFAAVQGLVNAQGRGNAVLAAADYLANVAAKDSTNQYYSIAQAFVAKVAVADSYTSTHPNTVSVSQLIAGASGGGGLVFTTSTTDTITLTGSNNVVSASVDTTNSKSTFNTGDLLVGGSADTLNVSAKDDLTATNNAPTIKGLGKVNFTLNAITSATHTVDAVTWNVDTTNIDKGTALYFDNVAPVTAINGVTIAHDKGGVRSVSGAFSNVSDDVTADSTFNINAVGTTFNPATLTLTAAVGNTTVNAAGSLTYVASTQTGLVQLNAAGAVDISAVAAVAAIVNTTGALNVTHLDAAKTVSLTSTAGKITTTAGVLDAAVTVNANAAKTAVINTKVATTVNLSATGTSATASSISESAAAVKSVSLTGNGGALYADLTGLAASSVLANLTVAGTQPVTAKLDASKLANLTTINKTSSGTFGVDLIGSGSVDFSSQLLDSLKLKADIATAATKTLTVANGQVITVANDQGAGGALKIAGKATTDAVTLILNDGTLDTAAADLTSLSISKIGTLTIDASQDHTAAGGASTSVITSLVEDSTTSTNVIIHGGANGITFGTAFTLTGGNTLTIDGSGAVTFADPGHLASGLTVGTIDASANTSIVTLGGTTDVKLAQVSNIKTGAGNDAIYLGTDSSATGPFSVNTDGGDDTININGSLGTNSVSIDGGTGSNTLVIKNASNLNASNGKTISINNIQTLEYDTATAIDANLLSGSTYLLKDNHSAGSTITVTTSDTKTTSVDLSTLSAALADSAVVAKTTFSADLSGSTVLTSYIGSSVAKNNITTSANVNATYVGGSKVDAFVVKAGEGTFTGGAGADTYDLTLAKGATATKFTTITDFAVENASGNVDALTLGSTAGILISAANLGAGWTVTSGVATKAGSTLATFLTAFDTYEVASGANGDTIAYASGSDLYIAYDADQVTGKDVVVKLTGIATIGVGYEVGGAAHAGYVSIV